MPHYQATLSHMDQLMPIMNTAMWQVFSSRDSEHLEKIALTLKEGLDRMVACFPFLSGEIYIDTEDQGKVKIQWEDDDPRIIFEEVVAETSLTVKEFESTGFDLHKFPYDLFPPRYKETLQKNTKPALIASCTKIEGGLLVLLAPHHSLVDGGGRQFLYQTWASCTQDAAFKATGMAPDEPLSRSERFAQMITTVRQAQSVPSQDTNTPQKEPEAKIHIAPAQESVPKMFQFSVNKLERMRRALRAHTKSDFTLNTMLTALLWVNWVAANARSRSASDPAFDGQDQYSALLLVLNMRALFEKESLLEKNTWLGNLASHVMPQPRLTLGAASGGHFELDLGPGAHKVPCRKIIPDVIDTITDGLANTSLSGAVADLSQLLQASSSPGFDWAQLRQQGFNTEGELRFIHSNWGALDLLPDFGPHVGRPVCATMNATGAPAGICVTFPRHRDKRLNHLFDLYRVLLTLRVDEVAEFEQDELLKALGPA
ncbi:hypothetical protein E8E14_011094 [Neopestalotiopsis sp. 37M]|nr:hypothetical protein E8E14_011094 [Neopestalotiopsis sp. 37M]